MKFFNKDSKIGRGSIPIEEPKKKKFNTLVEEKSYEFHNLKEKINPNNLIYKYKTEGRSHFSRYQNQIDRSLSDHYFVDFLGKGRLF